MFRSCRRNAGQEQRKFQINELRALFAASKSCAHTHERVPFVERSMPAPAGPRLQGGREDCGPRDLGRGHGQGTSTMGSVLLLKTNKVPNKRGK